MLITTTAFKTSNGQCYESKETAYNEEIKQLIQSLPKYDDKRLTAGHLKRLNDDVTRWLLLANEVLGMANRSPDDKKLLVVKEFEEFVYEIMAWIDNAEKFIKQMSKEADVEIRRSLAEQGG